VVTPKVLGVDDFAFKKGHAYGTILVDLEKRIPVDLLPDREGKTLEEWLKAHPGVEIVTRDRSSVYANAVSTACPAVKQVADRWHLLKNLSENLERHLDTQRNLIKEAAEELSQQKAEELKTPPLPLPPNSGSNPQPLQTAADASVAVGTTPTEKRYQHYREVKRLQQQGHSAKGISRHLGISRNTVRKYLRQASFVPKTRVKRSNLIQYEEYLRKRWNEGGNCVFTLYKEIKPILTNVF
jgi:transposase